MWGNEGIKTIYTDTYFTGEHKTLFSKPSMVLTLGKGKSSLEGGPVLLEILILIFFYPKLVCFPLFFFNQFK